MKIFFSLLLWPGLALAQTSKPLVQADISHVADTAHVEFRGLKNWRYDVQRPDNKKLVMTLAPLDDASVAKLRGFSDAHITSVTVDKNGVDGDNIVTFFLAQPNVEHFDYLTDEPSRLIVDLYRKPDAETKPAEAGTAAAKTKAAAKTAKKTVAKIKNKDGYVDTPKPEKESGRAPAGDEFLNVTGAAEKPAKVDLHFGIFDGSDENYDRFRIKDYEIREEAAISSRNNIYLPFPMLKMKVSILGRLLEQLPEYVINPKDTAENKEARLLLTLFNRKRFGHFEKTYEYYIGKYPNSEYGEILKNLAAYVHLQKWREDKKASDYEKARAMYTELVQKYPGSPLREYNYLILGFAQLEHGEALATLQTFEGFITEYPKSPEVPHVRSARAEAYMILRKYDEASAEYQSIMKDFARTPFAQEARYRLGDAQFAKGDFNEAIRTYEAAIKDLPKEERVYPNANFNMAEARFWQKDFKKALGNYVQFVNLFPTHEHGGYALTRIGELLGILGADPRRVMGAFLESYFRFPEHPGAKVARIRMLSQQMRGMKETEVKRALQEIKDASKVELPGMEEFTTLMAAEGLTNRGQYKEALDSLIVYYQKNPSSMNLGSFKQRILRNIANELKDGVDKGEFMKALSFYSKYSGNWLKNSGRIDVPYIVGGAYENAGAYDEAERIYRAALIQRQAIVNTPAEKEKKVQEHLPSVSSLNLRLASVLTQERNYIDAFQHLKTIGTGAELSPEENIERVRLSAQIAEQRNDLPKAREALVELSKRWQGDPALVAPVHLQLAQTYLKMNDPKQAEYYADKALAAESAGEKAVSDKILSSAFQVKGEALMAQKKAMAAVESYQKLLERFEDKMPLASVRYKVGQILFDRGDFQAANDVWKRLEGTPSDFLWKIGREKLADSQWKGDYNKYINRIPAMTSNKKEKQ